jgi:hypothetical protein
MTSSLFRSEDFGGPRAAHGADASRQVSASSSFAPQGIRQSEYISLARQCDDNIETLKSLRANFLRCAGTTAGNDTSTTLGQFNATMRKARIQLSKSEAADEDGESEDASTACQNAAKLLQRAAKLLAAAEEDVESEEDDAALESAKTAYRKCKARLTSLKAKPATAATVKAEANPAETAKAWEDISKHTDKLQNDLAGVVALLANRNGGMPAPRAHIMKAANDTGPAIPTNAEIAQYLESGKLTSPGGIQAKLLKNMLQQGAHEQIKERLAKTTEEGVRQLFDAFR